MRPILVSLLATITSCHTGALPTTGVDISFAADAAPPPAGECDLVRQTGCKAGDKCVPATPDANSSMLFGACVANGSVPEGSQCVSMLTEPITNDNCVAGTVCENALSPTSHCRRLCAVDSTCPGGQACASIYGLNAPFGECLPTCTPFGTDCPSGSDCSLDFLDFGAPLGTSQFFVCKPTGSGALLSRCMHETDCSADLFCDSLSIEGGRCVPHCDGAHPCPVPPAQSGVTALSCQQIISGIGRCTR
jgi:hypothetical protein